MLVFLLHSMKLLFTKPIPPNPAPSKIIPIISETLYIYLIGFHPLPAEEGIMVLKSTIIGFSVIRPLSPWERARERAKPQFE